MIKLGEQMEAGNVVLTDSEGNVIVSYTALKTYDCVIIRPQRWRAEQRTRSQHRERRQK